MVDSGQVLIGTSGWSYKHWEKTFYPEKMPPAENLGFFARHFRTVEVNYSYYQLPPRSTFALWREKSPEGTDDRRRDGSRVSLPASR